MYFRRSMADRPASATRAGPAVQAARQLDGQREDGQRPAERRVVVQRGVATDRAQPGMRVGQSRREPDAGPAADAGQHRHVLLALVLIGHDVADDARRRLEPVQLLAGLGIDRLQVAFQRAVEHHAALGRHRAGPDGELLRIGPDDLALGRIPGDEVAHVGLPGRRIHRQCRTDIGLARSVRHAERLVVHAHVVGRHVEQLGLRRIRRRLLVLAAQRGRADALRVHVFAGLARRVLRHDVRPAVGRTALVHVDAGGPVHRRIVFRRHQQLAGRAVQRVAEPVAVEVHQRRNGLSADVLVRQDHLVDAVIVPLIVRRHLIDPASPCRYRHRGRRSSSTTCCRLAAASGSRSRDCPNRSRSG